MKILLVASSTKILQPTLDHLDKEWEKISFSEYSKGEFSIYPLVTGFAPMFMPYALAKFSNMGDIDKVIYIGLAAATTRILEIGQTVNVGRDIIGDVGIEESDGKFQDMFNLKEHDPTKFPFFRGEIFNEDIINPLKLRVVKAISVNKIPGTFERIEELEKKYHAEIVTHNGAAFAYSCKMLDVEYLQMRTIYQYLEPTTIGNRDKEEAIRKLNIEFLNLLKHLPLQKRNTISL